MELLLCVMQKVGSIMLRHCELGRECVTRDKALYRGSTRTNFLLALALLKDTWSVVFEPISVLLHGSDSAL